MKQLCWGKIITETFLEESGINDRIKLGDEKARIFASHEKTSEGAQGSGDFNY